MTLYLDSFIKKNYYDNNEIKIILTHIVNLCFFLSVFITFLLTYLRCNQPLCSIHIKCIKTSSHYLSVQSLRLFPFRLYFPLPKRSCATIPFFAPKVHVGFDSMRHIENCKTVLKLLITQKRIFRRRKYHIFFESMTVRTKKGRQTTPPISLAVFMYTMHNSI